MKKLFAAFLVLAGLCTMSLTGQVQGVAEAAATPGCDDYAIMRCGADSPQQFITKAKANKPGDLPAIFAHYGLPQSDYQRFANNAVSGKLYNDGRIVVDGQTVGRSTMNVGRVKDSSFNERVTIGGNTYWGGPFGSTYHANQADVMVLFDNKGVMQFAAIASCGNPQKITPNAPNYSCDKLKKNKISKNTYEFSARATANNGAEVVKVEYDFGDGTTKTTRSLTQTVRHTFKDDATVKLKITFKLPGGATDTVTSEDCLTKIVYEETEEPPVGTPAIACTLLEGVLINADTRQYRFTATASYSKEVQFTGADFDFGDGVTMTDVQPNGNNQAIINHSYATDGEYTVKATLYFSNGQGSGEAYCETVINPETPIEYCKPGVPVGSDACEDQLIATGPGAIALGLFGGFGSLAGVGHYFYRRRLGL